MAGYVNTIVKIQASKIQTKKLASRTAIGFLKVAFGSVELYGIYLSWLTQHALYGNASVSRFIISRVETISVIEVSKSGSSPSQAKDSPMWLDPSAKMLNTLAML